MNRTQQYPGDDDQQWLADQVLECYGPAALHRFWECVYDGCFGLIPHWRWSAIELADVLAHISWVHFELRALR
jgi:hypothetical protein